nr:TspO/MBR family protein [Lysobacter sp. CAU 1642]
MALSFAAALGGALFPPDEDYARLVRPSFAPPGWLFGPVWTLLYVMMAVAAWRVWSKTGAWSAPLRAWYLQLTLNAAWTPLFFGLGWRGVALLEMAVLWALILATALRFRPHSGLAFGLMLPYLAWVSFAWVLNGAFWWLNR